MAEITEHPESFEVVRTDGWRRSFQFDDNPSRRAISGRMTKKQALQAAKAFAGRGHTIVKPDAG